MMAKSVNVFVDAIYSTLHICLNLPLAVYARIHHGACMHVYVVCCMAVSPQAWTQCSRWEGWAFMKEFCNFQNCGLSFTLFNKMVWALIMENGCTGREGERLSGRETFGRLLIHFPFHNICFAVFSLGTPWVIISGVFRLEKKEKVGKTDKESA